MPAVLEHVGFSADVAPAVSVNARIALHAAQTPGNLALTDGSQRLTFGELNTRAEQLAARLCELGAMPEVCIGLLFDRSVDFVVAALAVLKSGAAYLPIDVSTPADRIEFILSNADVRILLTHRENSKNLPAGTWHTLNTDQQIDHPSMVNASLEVAFPRIAGRGNDADLAYVIYTSGSTGRPKGVEITHGNLLNLIAWHQSAFNVTGADHASQVAGFGFDAAGWEIWPALTAGASLHIADEITRRSPQALRDWLVAEEITIAFVPTLLAEQLVHSNWPANTALRIMLTGADTLHRRPVAGLPFALINNYGPTECTVVATSGSVSPHASAGPPPIGRPIRNTIALILNEAMQAVADGTPGELCLAGAHVGRGYRNLPEMTASRFVMYTPRGGEPVRIYRTGDRAKLLPNGEIAFLGRLDDQVKIRGYRIELGEIVANIDRIPGIEASAASVRETAEGPELIAYLVLAHAAKPSVSDIRDFLAARLPDYMIPAKFVTLPALPLTTNGKLDKSALPAPDATNQLATAVIAPAATSNGIEPRIAGLVASLLGQPTVASEDNFFMLGGHSMLGVQLVARIRDTFGVKLTLRQLFGAPTVAALAKEVSRLTTSA